MSPLILGLYVSINGSNKTYLYIKWSMIKGRMEIGEIAISSGSLSPTDNIGEHPILISTGN